jgi:hypothetical protein
MYILIFKYSNDTRNRRHRCEQAANYQSNIKKATATS